MMKSIIYSVIRYMHAVCDNHVLCTKLSVLIVVIVISSHFCCRTY